MPKYTLVMAHDDGREVREDFHALDDRDATTETAAWVAEDQPAGWTLVNAQGAVITTGAREAAHA